MQTFIVLNRLVLNFTTGCKDKILAPVLKDLIETDNFKVTVIDDVDTVEVCGALKVRTTFNTTLRIDGVRMSREM